MSQADKFARRCAKKEYGRHASVPCLINRIKLYQPFLVAARRIKTPTSGSADTAKHTARNPK
jgi:hypothetical protein